MPEYIECRNCYSPNCKGCNIYTLVMMFNDGKFDDLIGDDHSINPFANVVPVVHGRWEMTADGAARCTACGRKMNPSQYGYPYCSLCGARMDGE